MRILEKLLVLWTPFPKINSYLPRPLCGCPLWAIRMAIYSHFSHTRTLGEAVQGPHPYSWQVAGPLEGLWLAYLSWRQLPSLPGREPVLPRTAQPGAFSPIRSGLGCQVSRLSASCLAPGLMRLLGFIGYLQVGADSQPWLITYQITSLRLACKKGDCP